MNGWLLIDKPGGITSRDAVNQVQNWFPKRTKIGHTGTLDPLATGLLVLAVGQATRLADYVQAQGKSYLSQFRFGATSDTDDANGVVQETPEIQAISQLQLEQAFQQFLGNIQQVPPGYSAVKVNGVRAHRLARAGAELELKAREVRVDQIQLLKWEWPFAEVRIDCGKGTYIRSIARDVGQLLRVGGLVQTLRRTRVGAFQVEQALKLDATREQAHAALLPLDAGLQHLSKINLPPDLAKKFQQGQLLKVTHPDAELVRVYGEQLLGLAEVQNGVLKCEMGLRAE